MIIDFAAKLARLTPPPTVISTPERPLTQEEKDCERAWRKEVRQLIRDQRRSLTPEEVQDQSSLIHKRLLQHPFLQQSRRIASYMSFAGEIDTHVLNDLLKDSNHQVGLPVIDPEQKGIMHFYRYLGAEHLVENALKILEPKQDKDNYIAPSELEVVLVPLVAFAPDGARIGMGGGYYDRLLKKIHPKCLTIGLAYDFQRLEHINIQSWDVPLDEILTPTQHYRIKAKY